jgi:DNA invertase Pin-like site-specific DNA recombinase
MRAIGYARVSTREQDITGQVDDLKKFGCDKIFEDVASGSRSDRPGLDKCLADLRKGDLLVVHRLDRIGRSHPHLIEVVNDLQDRGVGLKTLHGVEIDTTTASGKLVFHIFSAMAEFERGLIRERTRTGLAAARARGRKGGRKPVRPDDPRVLRVKQLYDAQLPLSEICGIMGISKRTIYRWLDILKDAQSSE